MPKRKEKEMKPFTKAQLAKQLVKEAASRMTGGLTGKAAKELKNRKKKVNRAVRGVTVPGAKHRNE